MNFLRNIPAQGVKSWMFITYWLFLNIVESPRISILRYNYYHPFAQVCFVLKLHFKKRIIQIG